MSVTIQYQGTRKKIKSSGSSLVQQLIEDACNEFGISSLHMGLQHNKKLIEKSQPIRFCGIPNNAVVDLIPIKNKLTGKTRIALSAEGCGSSTSEFSLEDVLKQFISQGFLPSDVLQRSPLVVYLRQQFTTDQLSSVTLLSLGLDGSSARLQLRLEDKADPYTMNQDQTSSSTEAVPPTQLLSAVVTASPSENDSITCNSKVEDTTAKDERTVEPLQAVSNPTPDAAAVRVTHTDPVHPGIDTSVVKKAISDLLHSNFDQASRPAILTICKYIDNLISHPGNHKYRVINTGNKIYRDVINGCKGADRVLAAAGFTAQPPDYLPAPAPGRIYFAFERIDYSSVNPANSGSSSVPIAALLEVRKALVNAMDELEIPPESRPPSPTQQPQKQSNTPSIPFDPYKPLIVRTSQQPRAAGVKSDTEVQLEQLEKKRRALEGDRESVTRNTQVYMAWTDATTMSDGKVQSVDVEDEDDSKNQSMVMKSVMKKIVSDPDGPPLTTRALRELEKLKKQVVYDKTLVKVRFSDKVCIQGNFHPRDTVENVRDWLYTCFARDVCDFELYTTPPRIVLPLNESLSDLHLVPAAVMYVSWKGSQSSMNSVGDYLTSELREELSRSAPDGEVGKYYPTGQKLATKVPSEEAPAVSESKQRTLADTKSTEKKSSSSSDKKPKWLKI